MGQPQRVFRLGLAGDTMLGRSVAEILTGGQQQHPWSRQVKVDRDGHPTTQFGSQLFSDEVVALAHEADVMVVNLECCVSTHDKRWPNPRKPFFFRAPPSAVRELQLLRVQAVTLANNHALDYNVMGLLDSLEHLDKAGIKVVGAGKDLNDARKPMVIRTQDFSLGIIGVTDHPEEFSATPDRPGVAFANFQVSGVPSWIKDTARQLKEEEGCNAVLLTPHWGPNMCPRPLRYVRETASAMHRDLPQVDLVAGHSAHNFQGAWGKGRVLFDMGDFIDDYARDEDLRNDVSLFFFVLFDKDTGRPFRVEAVPLKLEFCHTRLAKGSDFSWVKNRFTSLCAEMGTTVREEEGGRLTFDITDDKQSEEEEEEQQQQKQQAQQMQREE